MRRGFERFESERGWNNKTSREMQVGWAFFVKYFFFSCAALSSKRNLRHDNNTIYQITWKHTNTRQTKKTNTIEEQKVNMHIETDN